MKFIPGTLRGRLVLLIVLVTLPGLLLLSAFVWAEQVWVAREAEQRVRTTLEVLAASQRELVQHTKRFLQRLSAFDEVRNPADPACSRFLRQALKLSEAYVNLGVPRSDGELLCNALSMPGVVNVADRGYFQRALRDKKFSIGEFQIDRAARQTSVNFSYPVTDPRSGRIRGVVVAVVSLDWWSRKLGEIDLPDGAVAFVTDANGTIIAHYPPNSRALGLFAETYAFATRPSSGSDEQIRPSAGESGKSQGIAYANSALFADSLNLSVGVPYRDLLATSRGYLWWGVAVILFGMALAVILMSWAARVSILRPLTDLFAYTHAVESGSVPVVPAAHGASELRTLQERIVSMGKARLEAESRQRRSEARFRQIAETIQEVFWIVSSDWNQVIYVNPAYESIWQQGVVSLYREPYSWLEVILPEDRQKVIDYLEQIKRDAVCDIQFPIFRIERKDGTLRWISVRGFPVRDEAGDASDTVGIAEDVTERIQYEAELSEREAKYRLLVEHAEDLVVKVDTDGRFLFVSPSYCRTFGKSEHQLLGKTFMPLVHEEDKASTLEAMKSLYYPPFRAYVEQRAMTARGWRWFGWSDTSVVVEDGTVAEIIGVGRDITEQKRVEFALRESESRYRELVDNMSDGVVVYQRLRDDGDFVIKELNRAAERITQHQRKQIVGRRAVEIFPGIRQLGLLEVLAQVAETGEPRHHPVRQYRDQRLNLWVENYVFRLPSGEVVAVFKDMTTEKRAMLALRNSEEKFRGVFENLSLGVVIADSAGMVLEINKSFSDILNVDRSVAAGRRLLDLFASGEDRCGLKRVEDVLGGRDERCSFRFTCLRRDHHQITADVSIGVLRSNSGESLFVYGIIEDVTALVEAEETRATRQ